MVRQHVYRMAGGGHTVAASSALMYSAWLPLLEDQLKLIDFSEASFPVYYQYPLGAALVLSRYEPDEIIGGTARQLVFDDVADAERLQKMRPLSLAALMAAESAPVGLMEDIDVGALAGHAGSTACFQALDKYFAGNEELLARFIGAVSLCARDKRVNLRVALDGSGAEISEAGRRIMEMVIRSLSAEDAHRLSFCTFARPDSAGMRFSVSFCADRTRGEQEILIDLTSGEIILPEGVSIPDQTRAAEAAQALMAHDLVRLGRPHSPAKASEEAQAGAEPFEKGMSLEKYFSGWRHALLKKQAELTDEGFRALASVEWKKLLNAVVAASELMDNMKFLSELSGMLTLIRRDKMEEQLALDGETTTDLIVLLLDSVQWRQVELVNPKTARLLRSVTAYSQILNEEQCSAECLAACRVIYRLLTAPAFVQESLIDMAMLENAAPGRFEAVQDCLKQYVQNRMTADIDVIDEAFAAAAMLAFARFSDGVPDLRLADKLAEHLEAKNGSKAARRFEKMMDKLRRNLHSKRMDSFRWKDMKLLIIISGLLVLLIVCITIGFLIVY